MYMILVKGVGYTIKDICADQDVCMMFKQFEKLLKKLQIHNF